MSEYVDAFEILMSDNPSGRRYASDVIEYTASRHPDIIEEADEKNYIYRRYGAAANFLFGQIR